LLLINKALSQAAFILLLFAGWLALNYVRTEWRHSDSNSEQPPAVSAASPALQETSAIQSIQKAQRLVYICASDNGHYHALTHLQHCKRTGLSEEAAIQRGLKRCSVCLSE